MTALTNIVLVHVCTFVGTCFACIYTVVVISPPVSRSYLNLYSQLRRPQTYHFIDGFRRSLELLFKLCTFFMQKNSSSMDDLSVNKNFGYCTNRTSQAFYCQWPQTEGRRLIVLFWALHCTISQAVNLEASLIQLNYNQPTLTSVTSENVRCRRPIFYSEQWHKNAISWNRVSRAVMR